MLLPAFSLRLEESELLPSLKVPFPLFCPHLRLLGNAVLEEGIACHEDDEDKTDDEEDVHDGSFARVLALDTRIYSLTLSVNSGRKIFGKFHPA